MFSLQRFFYSVFLAYSLVAVARIGVGEDLLGTTDSVLVLHNGRVLRGAITHLGDYYVVSLGKSGDIRVPANAIEMHCENLDEAYQRKRGQVKNGKIQDHLQLAEWCLRHELLGRTAEQLIHAMAIAPSDIRVQRLETRLRLARKAPVKKPETPPSKHVITEAEIERTVDKLPDLAVRQFTTTIQPLLVNSCGAAACHGSASKSDFRLVRPTWGRAVPRRLTQRNLYTTVHQIDRNDHRKSPLLQIPGSGKCNAGKPVFDDRNAYQLSQLTAWVRQVPSNRAFQNRPATFPQPNMILSRPNSFLSPAERKFKPVAPYHNFPPLDLPDKMQPATTVAPAAKPQPKTQVLPVNSAFKPRDEFDPQIFNRRYHSDAKK